MATHAQLQVYNNQFQKRTVEGSVNEYQEQSVCKLINTKITANMIYYKRQIIIVIEGQVTSMIMKLFKSTRLIAVNKILFQTHFKGDRIHTET